MAALADCRKCPLARSRSRVVNGCGPGSARIAVVGEAPGAEEDRAGRPFVGRAGHVLAALCRAAEIDPSAVFLTNSVRCRPPGNRTPKAEEIAQCRDYLIEELRELAPAVIVSAGGPALHSLFASGATVSSVMGQTVYGPDLPDIPIVPTYHPSYVMRGNWNAAALVLSHLQKARRIAEQGVAAGKPGSYHAVTTLEELTALRDYLLSDPSRLLSLDTETTGLNWQTDELLCISVAAEPGVAYVIPILSRHERKVLREAGRGKTKRVEEVIEYYPNLYWKQPEEMERVYSLVGEILASPNPKAGQGFNFDYRFLERSASEPSVTAATAFGWRVENLQEDALMASRLLRENLPANLTALTSYWTDLPYYESEILAASKSKKAMWEAPDETLWQYAGADADAVLRVLAEVKPALDAEGGEWLYRNVGVPLVRCAAEMGRRGVQIDLKLFDALCDYYAAGIRSREADLALIAGREGIGYSHYTHLQKLLFEELGLPLPAAKIEGARQCPACSKSATACSPGHAGTGLDALAELAERTKHPVLPVLIDLKKMTKLHSTYLDGGSGGFRRFIGPDGRVHPGWKPGAAETGRFTCEQPNMMNVPKNVAIEDEARGIDTEDAFRELIVGAPGCGIMMADWTQLEVWVLAYTARDEALLELLERGKDIHTDTARRLGDLAVSRMFPKIDPELDDADWARAHEDIRSKAKPIVFGIQYGLTPDGAAARLGCSLEEAAEVIEAYLHLHPGIQSYAARIREQVLREHVVANVFGRKRHFPEVPVLLILGYRNDIDALVREAVNFPIQSGGHDLMSLAHVASEFNDGLRRRVQIVAEVHDSLLFEYTAGNEKETQRTAWMIKELWESVARDTVLADGSKLGWRVPADIRWGFSQGRPLFRLTPDGRLLNLNGG